jgi:cell division protein FtsI/penicillin-binding protein 2
LRGASGVESSMNAFLAGRPGVEITERDAQGREIPRRRRVSWPAEAGGQVVLTLDWRIQQIAEAALLELAAQHHPSNASILVLRPRTGELVGWACWPPFTPAGSFDTNAASWINCAIEFMFEPGSSFKAVTLGASLSVGLVTLDQLIDCRNGILVFKGARVTDHGLAYGLVPVRFGFAKSLNTMHALLALNLGPERFFFFVTNFGFGQCTGVQLPGEMPGWIGARANPERLPEFYAGFGQGISVTPLQLLMAYGTIANDGLLMRPRIVARLEDAQGSLVKEYRPEAVRQVLTPQVAALLKEALEEVVTLEGTGRLAAMTWHTCGGKTGTAEQADGKNGYAGGRVCAFFFGMFPARKPELVIGITVSDPQGHARAGGSVAAPFFRRVGEQAAIVLNIPPDKPNYRITSNP